MLRYARMHFRISELTDFMQRPWNNPSGRSLKSALTGDPWGYGGMVEPVIMIIVCLAATTGCGEEVDEPIGVVLPGTEGSALLSQMSRLGYAYPMAWFPGAIIAIWKSPLVRFLRSVCDDLIRGAAILLSMEAIWWIINRMALAGYPVGELDYFQRVHFVTSLSAFGLVCLNFVVKPAIGYYQESRHD